MLSTKELGKLEETVTNWAFQTQLLCGLCDLPASTQGCFFGRWKPEVRILTQKLLLQTYN